MSIFARVASFHFYELIALIALFSSLSALVAISIAGRHYRREIYKIGGQSFAKGINTGLQMKFERGGVPMEIAVVISDKQAEGMASLIGSKFKNFQVVWSNPSKNPSVSLMENYKGFENESPFVPPVASGQNFTLLDKIRDEAFKQAGIIFRLNDDIAGMERRHKTGTPLMLQFTPMTSRASLLSYIDDMRESFVAAVMEIVTTAGVQLAEKPVASGPVGLSSTAEFVLADGPVFNYFLNHGPQAGIVRKTGFKSFTCTLDRLLSFIATAAKECDGLSTSQYMHWLKITPVYNTVDPLSRDTWIIVKVSHRFAHYMVRIIPKDQPKIKVNGKNEISIRAGDFAELVGFMSSVHNMNFGTVEHVERIWLQSDRP